MRLEEKEEEKKKEYAKLYQKYQELMRSHIDIMERRKFSAEEMNSQLSMLDKQALHRPSDGSERMYVIFVKYSHFHNLYY